MKRLMAEKLFPRRQAHRSASHLHREAQKPSSPSTLQPCQHTRKSLDRRHRFWQYTLLFLPSTSNMLQGERGAQGAQGWEWG